jgi:hypothetical protein
MAAVLSISNSSHTPGEDLAVIYLHRLQHFDCLHKCIISEDNPSDMSIVKSALFPRHEIKNAWHLSPSGLSWSVRWYMHLSLVWIQFTWNTCFSRSSTLSPMQHLYHQLLLIDPFRHFCIRFHLRQPRQLQWCLWLNLLRGCCVATNNINVIFSRSTCNPSNNSSKASNGNRFETATETVIWLLWRS